MARKIFSLPVKALFLLCITLSCNYSQKPKNSSATGITIIVQPFSDISKADVQYVASELRKIYPLVKLNSSINLPDFAFYPKRGRYRADSLIKFLGNQTPENCVTIGLTAKDISTNRDSILDWGVMGLGFCPGNACIASSFRLSKDQRLMQLFKVAIHELGHTQGLPHCKVKSCFMRDAEGQNPTNEETDFCVSCKAFLVSKGWKFKP